MTPSDNEAGQPTGAPGAGLSEPRAWLAASGLAAALIAVVVVVLRSLVGQPPLVGLLLAAVPPAVAFAATRTSALRPRAAGALANTVRCCAVVLAALAAGGLIVAALGQPPTGRQRRWIAASFLAAVVASGLAPLMQRWLSAAIARFAQREGLPRLELVDLLALRQSQGARLDDMLAELGEALRLSLGLRVAGWWAGAAGSYERVVAAPPRPPRQLSLGGAQERVFARMELVSGDWLAVWAPELIASPEDKVDALAPLVHAGELAGFLALTYDSAEREHAAAEQAARAIVPELCRQLAPLVQNARLDTALRESLAQVQRQATALAESRARVVEAGDAERRRIERNLHDGLQEQLVAVTLGLRLARELSARDVSQAAEILERLEGELERALEELRALAQGVYPPALQQQGLAAVLRAAARRAALPTRVEVELTARPPPDVEATIYFCCLEGIHNACKHAGSEASISVHVWEQPGAILFEVVDDGRGLTSTESAGTGLLNIEDRVGAHGGTLTIDSAPGRGTRLTGTLPQPAP